MMYKPDSIQQEGKSPHHLRDHQSPTPSPLLSLILIGVAAPLIPLVIWSFAHSWFFPAALPTEWSWRAWNYVFSDGSQVAKALLNSMFVALAVTLLSALIGLPAYWAGR